MDQIHGIRRTGWVVLHEPYAGRSTAQEADLDAPIAPGTAPVDGDEYQRPVSLEPAPGFGDGA